MNKIKGFFKEYGIFFIAFFGMCAIVLGLPTLATYVENLEKEQLAQFLVESEGWTQGKAEVWIYKNCKKVPRCLREDYLERYATWCGEKGLEWK